MKRDGRFPGDQAEITFTDLFVEQISEMTNQECEEVLSAAVALCGSPGGKHQLSDALTGWNTLTVLGGHQRVVYRALTEAGIGTIEVLCVGRRKADEVYDMAEALVRSDVLTRDELTQLWDAFSLLEVIAEDFDLDGWDYRPPPAPEGMVRAAVGAGLLSAGLASLLSKDELEAAMAGGWSEVGADPDLALQAAIKRARGGYPALSDRVIRDRVIDRCGALMPRAQTRCIRRKDHPGPHRST